MSLFDKFKKKESDQVNVKNELHNEALKEQIMNNALSLLVQGVDYDDLAGVTAEFRYLDDVSGRSIEALFQVKTDRSTVYFQVQKNSLMRIDITKEMYEQFT